MGNCKSWCVRSISSSRLCSFSLDVIYSFLLCDIMFDDISSSILLY
jgi:hypothetical protein